MFLCFLGFVSLIFPLFNFQTGDLTSLDGICEVFFVQNVDGKQEYVKQENVNVVALQRAEGIIIVFDKNVEEVKKILNFQQIKCEKIENMDIFYGYSNLYSKFIYLEGKQANVQIVAKGEQTIAGFPLILSGF